MKRTSTSYKMLNGSYWHWLSLFITMRAITGLETTRRRAQHMQYFPQRFLAANTRDDCTENGYVKYCKPELVNIIQNWPEEGSGRSLKASQTCGVDAVDRYCARKAHNSWGCEMCDAHDAQASHNVSYLNDETDNDAGTCWYSGSVLEDDHAPIMDQSDLLQQSTRNVSIEIDFRHLYEISFVYMRFCGPMPHAMIIYKSSDAKKTWQPYQYYANNCIQQFGIEPDRALTRLNEDEPLCTEEPNSPLQLNLGTSISFNVLHNRPSSRNEELNPILLNWQTAGAIKIELITPGLWPGSENAANTTLIDAHQFAISDIKIGGNCQCNGHADTCIIQDGKPVCQCKHGTEGETCNKCMPFHHDRPWRRGTKTNPNECKKCNCNLHARKCKFDSKKFEGNKQSGGICKRCKHNTTGDNCQYCVTGYTPDKTKKITDRKYCKQCSCHPVGSIGQVCNQTTGACPCKEGVTGKECTRCAKGYRQSDSFEVPCIKIAPPCRYPDDPKCPPKCSKRCPTNRAVNLNVNKFCKMGFVIRAEVKRRETIGDYIIATANIIKVYRPERTHTGSRQRGYTFDSRPQPSRPRSRSSLGQSLLANGGGGSGSKTRRRQPKIKVGQAHIWVKKTEDKCNCPKLRVRRAYLMMGKHKRISQRVIDSAIDSGARIERDGIHFGINRKTIALTWREIFERKLVSLVRKSRKECTNKPISSI